MDKNIKYQKGEMDFLVMILLFLGILFLLWVWVGGPDRTASEKPFINSYTNTSAPLQVYGPGDIKN